MKALYVLRLLLAAPVLFSLPAVAAQPEQRPAGLSNEVVSVPLRTETSRLLETQRLSGAPEQSELPANIYVDTQRRAADTFSRPIPDTLHEDTTGNR